MRGHKSDARIRVKKIRHNAIKNRKFKIFSLDKFVAENSSVLGRILTELCKLKILKKKYKKVRYTNYQKWLASNLLIGSTVNGYKMLAKLLPLPSPITVLRALRRLRARPGITYKNSEMIKLKTNLKKTSDKCVFLIMDEISLRVGLDYDQSSGSLFGFTDDGSKRDSSLSSSALCVMAVGVLKKFKYPLGYFFTSSTMRCEQIMEIITNSIKVMESAGFSVLGVTTDQGGNFEKCFRHLGVNHENPKFEIGCNSYYVNERSTSSNKECQKFS